MKSAAMLKAWGESWGMVAERVVSAPVIAFSGARERLAAHKRSRNMRQAHLAITSARSNDDFREMAFTFAVIALAAKLAEADGKASREEFIVFREVFPMPASEHEKIRHLFELAARDEASAIHYARQVASLFPISRHEKLLCDVMGRLFKVASADGKINKRESVLLREIARALGLGRREFSRLMRQHVTPSDFDPYAVLGVKPIWSDAVIRRKYHRLMREYHPDGVQARGGAEDEILLAQRQVASMNAAYSAIRRARVMEKA